MKLETYLHSYRRKDRLFRYKHIAFAELVAWGWNPKEAAFLVNLSTNRGSVYRLTKKRKVWIDQLERMPEEQRPFGFAFAVLIVNRWKAVKAYRKFRTQDCTDGTYRKRAARFLTSESVLYFLSRVKYGIVMSDYLKAFYERNADLMQAASEKGWSMGFFYTLTPWERRMIERTPKPRTIKSYCGAKTRAGTPCRRVPEPDRKRCKLHGGMSTGPKTREGKARCAEGYRRYLAAKMAKAV